MNSKLETTIGSCTFQTPVFCSSGCFGFGYEAADFADLSMIGAISYKSLTLEPRIGNPPPRIHEISSGVITSIGLQNPGFDEFLNVVFGKSKALIRPDQRLLSIAGKTVDDYLELAEKIANTIAPGDIAAIELNACCPNVSAGGGSLSKNPDMLYSLIQKIKTIVSIPLFPKIAVDYDYYRETAKAVEEAGADALYLSPTPLGMAIDIETGKPALGNLKGGISGPAVKPLGISYTWELFKVLHIPIIATGGVVKWQDAMEYIMAGATAVGIGAGNFRNPETAAMVAKGLNDFLTRKDISHISEYIGFAHKQWEMVLNNRRLE